jgi:MFS family permease
LLARIFATVAFQIQAVAVSWQMYALTGSAMYLGLVGLAQFLPMFVLTLPVGHVADRYDRRSIVRACQLVEGLATLVLAAACFAGRLNKESLLALVAVIGAARAFEGPSMQSLMPALVEAELFPRAAAWSASAFQVASIVGPALGGLLYALSPTSVFAAAAFLYLGSSILVSLIEVARAAPRKEVATLRSIFAGISFIRGKQIILGAISLDLFAVLLGGATALLPIYAKDILFTGSLGLGILRSAPAVGALAMSLFLARKPLRRRVGGTMFAAVAVFGLATTLFAVSKSFALSLGALFVLGAADVISVVVRQSLVQLQTPDEMRGG